MSSAPEFASSAKQESTSSDNPPNPAPSLSTRECLSLRERWWVGGLILGIILVRFILLGVPALIDPSETRFATSAQQMIEAKNFVTPKIHTSQGWENYWAKPPLHMWLTAASFKLFGYTAAGARFPGFVSIVMCATMVGALGVMLCSWSVGLLGVLAYLSCGGVFLFSAVSLTDPTLALWISSAFFATFVALFGVTTERARDWWFRGAFLGLGLGFLTKGPVAVVIFGVGGTLWLALSGQWSRLKSVPWRSGLALFLGCWLPWYLAAETATPGFLRYFFVQENFLRFVSSDESGVRYGTLHTQPRGMIWLMFGAVALPWSVIGLGRLLTDGRWRGAVTFVRRDERVLFLVCWATAAPLFFTAARQVLPTYTFSALPAVAVITALGIASLIEGRGLRHARSPGVARLAGLTGTIGLLGGFYGLIGQEGYTSGCVAVISLGAFAVLAANRYRQSQAAIIVPIGILGIVALYGGIAVGVTAYSSTNRSTKPILEAVRDDSTAQSSKEAALAILYASPHSVIFYQSTIIPTLTVVSMGSDLSQARAAGATRFLITESNIARLSSEELATLELRASRGKWRYYSSRQ